MMCQKLVRDNIPAIIEKNGETCVTRKLTDKEYETALAEKLQEEVKELLEAYTAKERSVLDCAEEMADGCSTHTTRSRNKQKQASVLILRKKSCFVARLGDYLLTVLP